MIGSWKTPVFECLQVTLLGSLHAATDMIIELDQLMERFEMETSEAQLREIVRDLQGKKTKAQKIAQPLLDLKDPYVVRKAFKIIKKRLRKHPNGARRGSRSCLECQALPRRAPRPVALQFQGCRMLVGQGEAVLGATRHGGSFLAVSGSEMEGFSDGSSRPCKERRMCDIGLGKII
jgi:hypothetical protein